MTFSMKKLLALLSVVFVCAATAFAAPPGEVVKVDPTTITLHWVRGKSGISKHGMANGGYGGGTREYTYKLTPQTTYWQGGKKAALSNIQKGATVQVTAEHGVASRIDIQ
jgi:hypothetical protein